MRDPGPLDSTGKPTNPRYQPDKGSKALRSHGVPHPSAGTPVGDLLRRQRASARATNPTQRAAHGAPKVRCPAGVPFPGQPAASPRSAAQKRERRAIESFRRRQRMKRFANVDYSRPYTTKRR